MQSHKYPGFRLHSAAPTAAGNARNCRNAIRNAGFAPSDRHFCHIPANGSVLMKAIPSLQARRRVRTNAAANA